MKKISTLLTGFLMMFFAASAQISDIELRETLDLINKDSLSHTVQCMENFESRRCNKTIGHNKKVAQYLVDRLKAYGIENARIDSFVVSIPNHWLAGPVNQYMYNVLGTLKGTGETDSTVIIGAHLDAISFTGTRPDFILAETAPGANDNASGCAVMIEMARIIYENNLKPYHNIDFMAYDAEEIGLLGSYYDAGKRRAANENIIVMLNNDVVAYEPEEDWGIYLVGHSNALDVIEKAEQALIDYTIVSPFFAALDTESSDNYPYYKKDYKAIRFVGKNYSAFPHSENDHSEILNFEFCRQIARMNFVLLAHYAVF
ncbi:MAG: M20/M25/M40 family metallo-hydrolase [Dysgonamonadaceae bacterium]|jgi:acetylornithine deacetylase/succinyl-diaminopimelate desuccinylase-like protein|nr:M20/M25/M40 family metallo-hydrolase [Dysgonamonadaceae bacterium]